jgi:methyl halide transferase
MSSTRQDADPLPDDGNLPSVLKQFEVAPCASLEIGCGTGANSLWLAARGFECTGIDPASATLRIAADRAQAANREVRWIRGVFPEDIPEESYAEGSFGFIFDRGVLELVTFPAQQRKFLKRIARLLSPEGIYYALISRRQGSPLPGGVPLWTAPQVRRALSPHLRILLLRPVLSDPSDKGSAPVWLCVAAKKRRGSLRARSLFGFRRILVRL